MKKPWPWKSSLCDTQDLKNRCDWRARHREWHEHRKQHRHYMHNRLYRQIYLSFMAVVLLVGILAAATGWLAGDRGSRPLDQNTRALLIRLLPAEATAQTLSATLGEIASIMHGAVGLYTPTGVAIARSGDALPLHLEAAQLATPSLTLPDGRLLLLEWGQRAHVLFVAWLLICSLLIALATWPVARRLSRRIERLQQQADVWGEGHLSVRMEIDGCDEIAELAIRFNQAAERVEALVNGQRAMLASASHELRSPLARIRMATSLLGDERPDLQDQIARDIAELDALISELLLASRLSSDAPALRREDVDLLGLAAEEARRVGAEVSGEAILLQADARLLRHLLRNLLENARRHGAGTPIQITLQRSGDTVVLQVCDHGPGVPESEREKIFEPFYRLPGSAETGEGAGYGLALVRRIARLHGGDVACLPRDTNGACFETRLPLH
ncbi:ATP-binding protein [Uliginosibacterium sp. 31-16]|uniref:HAMP domain-containing sensor histidine kinase n=1 Tax=Uliginosibacterium sp. 31-16 TaxID=3068315 RepID=UPI00273F4B68|nr:ATP-binding protein [Uliginosibacterium sp. 31-16]MDP5238222.1 ATP-binding protein [Uliginosibacterium sp. 31-16]